MPKGSTTANSKAAVGYNYCNKLFALERKWKKLNNTQRLENRHNQAEKLVDEGVRGMLYSVLCDFGYKEEALFGRGVGGIRIKCR